MNIKDKVEQNVIVWLLGTLLTGFGSGIATYKAVIEIADLRVVPSSEDPEELKKQLSQMGAEKSELLAEVAACESAGSEATDKLPADFRWRSENAKQLLVHITAPTVEGAGTVVAVENQQAFIITPKHVVFRRGKFVNDLRVVFNQARASRFSIEPSDVRLHHAEDFATFSLDLSAQWDLLNSLEEALSTVEVQNLKSAQLGEFLYITGHSTASSWQVSLPGDYKFYKPDGAAFLITGGAGCPEGHGGGAVYGRSWKIIGMVIDEERPFCRALSMDLMRNIFKAWHGIDLGFKN